MSNWIQLAGPNGYDFDEAVVFGDFELMRDIAVPLAGTARYVRHTDRLWPVAIHSVMVARVLEELHGSDAAAAGLLHDVHEAVIGDIPTPVAWHIGYEKVKELKREVDVAIFNRLGIPHTLLSSGIFKPYIDAADQAALIVEKQLMMSPAPRSWNVPTPKFEYIAAMHAAVKEELREPTENHEEVWATMFAAEYDRLVSPLVKESR